MSKVRKSAKSAKTLALRYQVTGYEGMGKWVMWGWRQRARDPQDYPQDYKLIVLRISLLADKATLM